MTAKDPVCGMDVEGGKAAGMTVRKGKTYFSCAAACKAAFLKAPEKYVGAEKAGKKGCA